MTIESLFTKEKKNKKNTKNNTNVINKKEKIIKMTFIKEKKMLTTLKRKVSIRVYTENSEKITEYSFHAYIYVYKKNSAELPYKKNLCMPNMENFLVSYSMDVVFSSNWSLTNPILLFA